MSSNTESQSVLETIVASLPGIANHLATVPVEQKSAALEALQKHYLQTVMNLGSSEEPAQKLVNALMAHVREQMDCLPSEETNTRGDIGSNEEYSVVERFLTRAVGALALLFVSPVIAFVWIGLKLQGPGPAIRRRMMEHGSPTVYSFDRGAGWVSWMVRRGKLQSLPSLWHLVNGESVLSLKDFAAIIYVRA